MEVRRLGISEKGKGSHAKYTGETDIKLLK